jgi:hypothetical protein
MGQRSSTVRTPSILSRTVRGGRRSRVDLALSGRPEPRRAQAQGVRRGNDDFVNSGYSTVAITAVFAAYFVGGIAQQAE